MHQPEKVILSNMCMIYKGDEILVQNRVHPSWPGIAIPGGHEERGQSIVAASIGEGKEETGLDIKDLQLCGIKQWFIEDVRYICFLYKANTFEGTLISTREGENFWIQRKDLMNYTLASNFEDMIQVFEREDISEQFRTYCNGEKISILK